MLVMLKLAYLFNKWRFESQVLVCWVGHPRHQIYPLTPNFCTFNNHNLIPPREVADIAKFTPRNEKYEKK